jgi:hypothetical protein
MGRKGSGKKPRHHVPSTANTAAQPTKTPRDREDVEFWKARPQWSFALLDLCAEVGGWLHLRQGEVDNLLARFRQWETMTWGEILAEGGRKRNHRIYVSKCCTASRERLSYLHLDDHEELLSLAVSGQARVIGILDRATFQILWWDPEHKVCPSTMRHT